MQVQAKMESFTLYRVGVIAGPEYVLIFEVDMSPKRSLHKPPPLGKGRRKKTGPKEEDTSGVIWPASRDARALRMNASANDSLSFSCVSMPDRSRDQHVLRRYRPSCDHG